MVIPVRLLVDRDTFPEATPYESNTVPPLQVLQDKTKPVADGEVQCVGARFFDAVAAGGLEKKRA